MSEFAKFSDAADKLAMRMRIVSEVADEDVIRENSQQLVQLFEKAVESVISLGRDVDEALANETRLTQCKSDLDRREAGLDSREKAQNALDKLGGIEAKLGDLHVRDDSKILQEMARLFQQDRDILIQEIQLLQSTGESYNPVLSDVAEGLRGELKEARSNTTSLQTTNEKLRDENSELRSENINLISERGRLFEEMGVKSMALVEAEAKVKAKETEISKAKVDQLQQQLEANETLSSYVHL